MEERESRVSDVLGLVGRMGDSLAHLTNDIEASITSLLNMIVESLPVSHVVLLRPAADSLRPAVVLGIKAGEVGTMSLRTTSGIVGEAVRTGQSVFVRDMERDTRFTPADMLVAGTQARSVLCHPIDSGEELLGVLYVASRLDGRPLGEQDVQIVSGIRGLVRDALVRSRQYAEVQRLATIDPLTGLMNRNQMGVVLDTEAERSSRYGFPSSLVMIDLDLFKAVNDTHGHTRGDMVLKAFARILRQGTRRVDYMFRYGGEEFLSFLPHIPKENAKIYAERIRRTTAETLHVLAGIEEPVTASMGIASFPTDGTDIRIVLEAADRALYRAKDEGRNRVVLA
jgi:diguanylate cyclase (GGDEF)-like protein